MRLAWNKMTYYQALRMQMLSWDIVEEHNVVIKYLVHVLEELNVYTSLTLILPKLAQLASSAQAS
jgi:hypothetical protein